MGWISKSGSILRSILHFMNHFINGGSKGRNFDIASNLHLDCDHVPWPDPVLTRREGSIRHQIRDIIAAELIVFSMEFPMADKKAAGLTACDQKVS